MPRLMRTPRSVDLAITNRCNAFVAVTIGQKIDSKKVHCLNCGANRFLSQALPNKTKKARTEEKPTYVVSPSSGDEISE
jgi:hypothetical protein